MDPVVAAILRGGLGLLFLAAGWHKLRDLAAFRASLAAYELLPERATRAAAAGLAVAELVASVALLAPVPAAPGTLLAVALLAVYTGAIAVNLARGRRDIDCGCAPAALAQPLGGGLVARNALLLGAALLCLAPTRPRSLVWLDGLTVLAAVGALAASYAALERLMATAPRLSRLRSGG